MTRSILFATLLPALSFSAVSLPAAVLADCPTAADLPGGIVVTDIDAATETFYPLTPGVIRSEYRGAEGEGSQSFLGQGVYWLQYIAVENDELIYDTRLTNAYPMKPVDMPLPKPGGAWNTQSATLEETGYIRKGAQSTQFGTMTRLTIGACGYDMILVTIEYLHDGYQEMVHYFPDLGIGLLAGTANDGEEMILTTFVSIQAANEN